MKEATVETCVIEEEKKKAMLKNQRAESEKLRVKTATIVEYVMNPECTAGKKVEIKLDSKLNAKVKAVCSLGSNSDIKLKSAMISSSKRLVEYLANDSEDLDCQIRIVSARTEEGIKFLKGYGGIAAFLRYAVDTDMLTSESA